ncbi:MAG: hypothetical protein KTU85_06680 [Acidimicrobiia bacterium]|nr:hypothetical protein [Acidimicrobiia bacterium]MCY4457879.1 hypothetical protein [Acidimicrobiaceae bacterium]
MTMTGIWTQDDEGWKLSPPEGFVDESALHNLIAQTPEMLPLSGKPTLLILGREVPLGSGYADLLAVETSGRPVIIEVKLAQNNEARRAVVAQILAYAANLHGTTREQLEDRVAGQLSTNGNSTLVDALRALQDDSLDADDFIASLDQHLREGRFRLVFVLDAIPPDLLTLVAYLEHVTDKLEIDLIAVNSFNVEGTSIVVPQQVTPERHEVAVEKARNVNSGASPYHPGSGKFEESISRAPERSQKELHHLLKWAIELEHQGFARLRTAVGKNRYTLRPELHDAGVSLVTIWNENGASLQFHRSVFDRRAPDCIEQIERLAGTEIGQGNTVQEIKDPLLDALTEAYKHAATT